MAPSRTRTASQRRVTGPHSGEAAKSRTEARRKAAKTKQIKSFEQLRQKLLRKDQKQTEEELRKALRDEARQSSLADRRIGEDSSLSAEDVFLQRLMQQKRRQHRGRSVQKELAQSKDFLLTHKGVPLENAILRDDTIKDDDLDDIDVTAAHFGSGSGGRKSLKDIYAEIIKKSKDMKRERQMQMEENLEIKAQLDAGFDELMADLDELDSQSEDEEEYRKFIAKADSLRDEARVFAEHRLLTDAEKAKRAALVLEEKERQRLQRLKAMPEEEDLASDIDDDNTETVIPGDEDQKTSETNVVEHPTFQSIDDLPFILQVPNSFEDLYKAVIGLPVDVEAEYIRRIAVLANPHLGDVQETQSVNLCSLSFLMFDHYFKKHDIPRILALTPSWHKVFENNPNAAAKCAIRRIRKMVHNGAAVTPYLLCFTQLVAQVFPSLDRRHPVTTPLILLLEQAIVRSLDTCHSGKGFVRVTAALVMLGKLCTPARKYSGVFLFGCERLLSSLERVDATEGRLNIINLWNKPLLHEVQPICKYQLLTSLLSFIQLHKMKPGFLNIIDLLPYASSELPDLESWISFAKHTWKPLQWQKFKKVAIKERKPRFKMDFNPRFDSDPDAIRAEERKLRKEHKRETKSATRALKREAKTIARIQGERQAENTRKFKRQQRKYWASMEKQAADYNRYQHIMKTGKEK